MEPIPNSHTQPNHTHEHFTREYHLMIKERQDEINFTSFWHTFNLPTRQTKINIAKFWDDIKSGRHDPHKFQHKLLNKVNSWGQTTQSWKIPPGILSSLNSREWKIFGGATFKEDYFPLDFEENNNRQDFLTRSNIKSKCILNPPFKSETIEQFLHKIVDLSITNKKHFFVILPQRTDAPWFTKFIINSAYVKILFQNNIAFLRGTTEEFGGTADELHLIWAVGIHGPTITVDNSPLGDFHTELKTFASFNFMYEVNGKLPYGKIKQWKIKEHLMKKNQIRITEFQERKLHARKIETPYTLDAPKETNILEDDIRKRTPIHWKTRLQKPSKQRNTTTMNSTAAQTFFKEMHARHKNELLCALCGSKKHDIKSCTQFLTKGTEIENNDDKKLFDFFDQLPTENDGNKFPLLRHEDLLEGEEVIARFQPHRYSGSDAGKQRMAIQIAHQRAKQCKRVMENKGITWTMPKNLTYSHIRYHLPYIYGYGFTKKFILRTIVGYRIKPETDIAERLKIHHEREMTSQQKDHAYTTIKKRLLQGKIVPVCENIPLVTHPEFLVIQKDKVRPVMDCSALNELYEAESVRFPTTDTALRVAKNSWTAAIDLSSAYNQTPIFPSDLQYFAIKSENKYYIPTGLPQGFSRAPEIFTRWLDPVVELLIDLGIPTVKLLDDLLFVLGNDKAKTTELQATLDTIRQIIADIGLRTNDKSQESAYSEIVYLGKLVNTALNQTFITQDKLARTVDQCLEILTKEQVTIRKLTRAIGLANFLQINAPKKFRHIFRRISEKAMGTFPLRPTRHDWEKLYNLKISLPIQAKFEILEWLDQLDTLVSVNLTIPDRKEVILYADSSTDGTGVYMKQPDTEWETFTLQIPYEFNDEIFDTSSTAREVIGIKKGLEKLDTTRPDKLMVRIFCDNEPSSYQIETMKTDNIMTRTALESIQTFIQANDILIDWTWHRRSTKIAAFTDLLSKEKNLVPTEKLRRKIAEVFECALHTVIDDSSFAKQLWRYSFIAPKYSEKLTKQSMIFIHPDIYLDQRWDILDWADEFNYQGMIMMPALTANPLRNMIQKNTYKRFFISANRLDTFFTVNPALTKKKGKNYIIFQKENN